MRGIFVSNPHFLDDTIKPIKKSRVNHLSILHQGMFFGELLRIKTRKPSTDKGFMLLKNSGEVKRKFNSF
jgi:hypothetical protein